jgi:hypothetical protein
VSSFCALVYTARFLDATQSVGPVIKVSGVNNGNQLIVPEIGK